MAIVSTTELKKGYFSNEKFLCMTGSEQETAHRTVFINAVHPGRESSRSSLQSQSIAQK